MGEKKRKLDALKRLSPTARFVYEYADRSNDTAIAPNLCLNCGAALTAATALTRHGARPREGCLSICSDCGHLQAFGADLKFRELTDEEIVEAAGDPDIVAAGTLRGRLREFWQRGDTEGAWRFVLANIRRDISKAKP